MAILVTGGAGFIGSEFVKQYQIKYPDNKVVVLDSLTYASNEPRLENNKNLECVLCDIGELKSNDFDLISEYEITEVVNFAAESHNDRANKIKYSSSDPFFLTNVSGTYHLLKYLTNKPVERIIHVSTDEVYGQTEYPKGFTEQDELLPRTHYSLTKKLGEEVCEYYKRVYNLPITITRGCNTFGKYQYPEKLIPITITRALQNKKIPVYGNGSQIREWITTEDHSKAILHILGLPSFSYYNIGTGIEVTNKYVVKYILNYLGKRDLYQEIPDPRGINHDFRYRVNNNRLIGTGWRPETNSLDLFNENLVSTIEWYRSNKSWWFPIIQSDNYKEFIESNYNFNELKNLL